MTPQDQVGRGALRLCARSGVPLRLRTDAGFRAPVWGKQLWVFRRLLRQKLLTVHFRPPFGGGVLAFFLFI